MNHQFQNISTNGINIRAAIQGSGPLVVLIHGFPESWYSWRHQMKPLAEAGFTACAIDVRGYGGSDKPYAVEAYDMQSICADIAGIVEALSPEQPAVLIGHDWGAPIAAHTAVLHPSKVRGVACLSVPYLGVPPMPLTQVFKAVYTDNGTFFYIVYFQDEGVAEAEFEKDIRGALRKLYFTSSADSFGTWNGLAKKHGDDLLTGLTDPQPFPAWLTPADIDYFVQEFEKRSEGTSAFRGPINRYRNFERDWEMMSKVADPKIHQPSLYMVGEKDMVITMVGGDIRALEQQIKANFTDFRGMHVLPKVGHWTQQEAPEATTKLLLNWLKTI